MHPLGLVTDSTADLPAGLTERFDVDVVPLVVSWDGSSYRDKVDLSTRDFYARLRASKSLPTTGAPSVAAFEAAFRKQLESHERVLSLHLPAKLSATYGVACKAAEAVDAQRIKVLDAGTITICLGWLLDVAGSMAEEGASFDEIVATLERAKHGAHIFTTIDSLDFLKRGGRIGRAQAWAGTLLSVKPIIAVHDGEVEPIARVRTLSAALRKIVELVCGVSDVERIAVMEGDAAASAAELERQVVPHFPELKVEHGEIGTVLGAHGGPGVCGIALLAKV